MITIKNISTHFFRKSVKIIKFSADQLDGLDGLGEFIFLKF